MSDNQDNTSLVYRGVLINRWDEMLSLTDMWRAAGKDLSKQPAKWRDQEATKAFVEHLEAILPEKEDGLYQVVRRGGNETPDTRAHWQIGLAYAKYLSPEFHVWCNTVVRDKMEGRIGPPEELELTEEGMRRLEAMQKAVVTKLLQEIMPPALAEMRASMITEIRKDLSEITGTDPAIVRQKGYRSMMEIAISHGCQPGSKGEMSFGRMVSGASAMARAWCAGVESRSTSPYPNGLCFKERRTENRPGIFMFHEIGIGPWLKEFGIPRFRAHQNAMKGQTVLQLVAPRKRAD